MTTDNKQRFSNRVENYTKYRPSYPAEYIDYLVAEVGLIPGSVVADIGAGTGILSRLLAPRVKTVLAVEPNTGMRLAAAEFCRDTANIVIVDGSAEATGLADSSLDFITAGQAFHWFDIEESRKEFRRILKPGGRVALVWNTRDITTPFGREYESLVKQTCVEYLGSGGGSSETLAYRVFFKNGEYDYRVFSNDRRIDLETLIGYSLSTSYAPVKGDAAFPGFVENLMALYDRYADDGGLLLSTATHSYVGKI
ncbi:class I SAM-dependent methyltransferase [Dehalogenimonas sp. THU2]|uniref:class I SAM-dependent methyltransferase n=1 Tax=Dehalogenimonas sp. THU2 TaxID=3151121 RepID=UPI0032184F71